MIICTAPACQTTAGCVCQARYQTDPRWAAKLAREQALEEAAKIADGSKVGVKTIGKYVRGWDDACDEIARAILRALAREPQDGEPHA